MAVIPWGAWKPDVSDYNGEHTLRVENVFPRGDGYGPVSNLSALTGALPSTCRGAFLALNTDGSIALFAGTATKLYKMDNTTLAWSDVSPTDATQLNLSGALADGYIGDMTGSGNTDNAFDTTTAQASAACATKASATSGYVGVSFADQTVVRAITVHGGNDTGFVTAANPTVTITAYGKTGTAPANATDGTALGSVSFTDTADESAGRALTMTVAGSLWDHCWVNIAHNGAAATISCAEVVIKTTDDYAVPASAQWQFAQLGTVVVAVNGADNNQAYTLGSSAAFADLGGSPPVARYITVVNEFIVLSGLTANPFRIAWSARSSATGWTAGTNESDVQDFADGGVVRGVAGGEFGTVLQDNAIRAMIYQPGSALVFSFDRICEGKGLSQPYSLVRAGERIFFRSASGFEVMVPGGQPQPIGKERFDRFFDEDYDSAAPQLLIGAYEPDSSRIYWAYKSSTGAAGVFNRIIVWDFVLERGSLITGVTGEYITALGVPAVTLEGLDATYASLEDIGVSLDDIPSAFAINLSIFDSSHRAGFLSGNNLEATLESAEFASGRRVMVRQVRPDTDAATVYSALLTRDRLADAAASSSEVAMGTIGFAFHRTDARLVKYRNRIPASTVWTFSIGVEPETVATGSR
jgi:hypothetical protein